MFPHTGINNFNCSVSIRTLLHQKYYTVLLPDKKNIGNLRRLYRQTIFIRLSLYVKVLEYLDGFLINSDVRRLIVPISFSFAVDRFVLGSSP